MRFLWKFLGALAALLLTYLAVALTVNPYGEFPSRRFPWVVPNSRREKLERFNAAAATGPIAGIVIGSSRSMQISPVHLTALTHAPFFNFAVFAATIEDDLAVLRHVVAAGKPPTRIILGLDQLVLARSAPSGELETNFELKSALEGTPVTTGRRALHWLGLAKAAIRPSYAESMVRSLTLALHPETPINAFDSAGGLRYVRWDAEIAAGTYDAPGAIATCNDRLIRSAVALDSLRIGRFIQLLQLADSIGARVTAWLPPYHPALLQRFEALPPKRDGLALNRATILDIARRHQVEIFDLTELVREDSSPGFWYDCQHFGGELARRIEVLLTAGVAPEPR